MPTRGGRVLLSWPGLLFEDGVAPGAFSPASLDSETGADARICCDGRLEAGSLVHGNAVMHSNRRAGRALSRA